MKINVHPMVVAQKAILDLPVSERHAATLQMLAPFDHVIKVMTPPGADPVTLFNLMRPDGPADAYRDALDLLEQAGAEATCKEALDRAASAIAATGYTPPIPAIAFGLFLMDTNPMMMKFSPGYTGFGGIPGAIMVNIWPDERNLPKLGPCTAHEFNHNIRNTVEVWRMDISVGEYVVMEGLAEAFAAELYGPDAVGPWVSEVKGEDLAKARAVVGKALEVRGFNEVRPYIFGDEVMGAWAGQEPKGVPAYAGYATGFHTVQAYCRKTGKSVAEATLVPSAEILRVADWF
ncbi:MAG TPA: DUF2268 domain-containing putative Zn-dependent protease [Symbiobacteriaceae bacterium]|nr:DUF2268 domain-containing putative Zn-dependent protease [Symbiobacteriaceae bacterium]